MFVLDEADVMIALQGHQDQSIRIHKLVSFYIWFLHYLSKGLVEKKVFSVNFSPEVKIAPKKQSPFPSCLQWPS